MAEFARLIFCRAAVHILSGLGMNYSLAGYYYHCIKMFQPKKMNEGLSLCGLMNEDQNPVGPVIVLRNYSIRAYSYYVILS